jgi:hypothetical protein
MDNVLLGVALVPDQATIDAAVQVGRALVGRGRRAAWCELVPQPYCLVYQACFSRALGSEILGIALGIGAEEAVIDTSLMEFGIQDGHLSWIMSRTDWKRLRDLQAKLLAALAPRRAVQSVVVPSPRGGNDALRRNLDRYGYRYCDDLFVPQLRLAYLSDLSSAMSSLACLEPVSRDCRFVKLTVAGLCPETGGIWPMAETQLVA